MADKRINLLSQQVVNPSVHSALRWLRMSTVFVGVLTFVVLGGLFIFKNRVETEYKQYLAQKESLINEFSTRRDTVQKVQYVAVKSKALAGLLSADPQFKNYYLLFTSTLPVSTQSASISTFVVDNKKVFRTAVSFSDQADAYAFMTGIENNMFTKVFSSLTVDSLSIGQSSTGGPVVVVNISGTFK